MLLGSPGECDQIYQLRFYHDPIRIVAYSQS